MAPVDGHADHLIELKDHQGICKVTKTEGNAYQEGQIAGAIIVKHATGGYEPLHTQRVI